MKTLLTLLLVSILSVASADVIYKWVDGQGNVHYGEEPGQQSAERMDQLPGLSTYEPVPIEPEPEEAEQGDSEKPAPGLVPEPEQEVIDYQSITIVSPENEQTIRSNTGTVEVFVAVDPPLGETDHIQVMLDGEPLPGQYGRSVFKLENVERGEHQLSVSIYSNNGKSLKSSESHTFYLHKAQVNRASPRI